MPVFWPYYAGVRERPYVCIKKQGVVYLGKDSQPNESKDIEILVSALISQTGKLADKLGLEFRHIRCDRSQSILLTGSFFLINENSPFDKELFVRLLNMADETSFTCRDGLFCIQFEFEY